MFLKGVTEMSAKTLLDTKKDSNIFNLTPITICCGFCTKTGTQTMRRVKYLVHALAIQVIPNSKHKPHNHTTNGQISMPRKETITLLKMNIGLVREMKKCCFLSSHVLSVS